MSVSRALSGRHDAAGHTRTDTRYRVTGPVCAQVRDPVQPTAALPPDWSGPVGGALIGVPRGILYRQVAAATVRVGTRGDTNAAVDPAATLGAGDLHDHDGRRGVSSRRYYFMAILTICRIRLRPNGETVSTTKCRTAPEPGSGSFHGGYMAVVVLRLDSDEVSALADCVARTLDEDAQYGREDLERLLRQLRAREKNSRHTSAANPN